MTLQKFHPSKNWSYDGVWITTKILADRWQISMRRVRQLARDRGIEGKKIGPICVWTEEDAARMKPRPPGAGSHTRNIIIKQLGADIEEIKSRSAS